MTLDSFARRLDLRLKAHLRGSLSAPLSLSACLLLSCAQGVYAQSSGRAGIPIPAGTWTMVLTDGPPPSRNGWEQLVYASSLKRSIMLSIYHQFNSEPNESLLGYNFDTNTWDILDMGGLFHTENMPEGGESQGFFDYNPNNNTIIYHCCLSGSNQPENPFHTWWYDLPGQSGRDKHTSPKPPFTALQPGGAFDVAHNTFVAHGGDSFAGTWTYDPVANVWQPVTANGTPPDPSLISPAMAYSARAQQVYLFGGATDTGYNSNLYSYDVPTQTWTLINPVGAAPLGRNYCGFAYDSTNDIFLLYGGRNGGSILGDTWAYNPETNTWTQLSPFQSPPITYAPVFAELTYDSDHNAFVLAQPGDGGYFGGTWNTLALQTWLFRYQGSGPNAGTLTSAAQPAPGSINRNTASWAKDPALRSSGNALYVAWSETGSPFDPSDAAWPHIYVSQYSGGSWVPLGSSFQSISSDLAEAHLPSLGLVGDVPWVSWYEASNNGEAAQVKAASWNGSSWTGAPVGTISAASFVFQGRSQLKNIAGVPYIALLEVNKNYYPQETFAFVEAWNGTSWNLVGSSFLNRNTGSGTTADSISMATDGTYPYVTWTEYAHAYGSNQPGDTDTNPQVYASAWNGSQWVALGGSLNVSSANWAYDASIACLGEQPFVAWTERTQSRNAQLYVKTWNGATWVLVGSGPLNQNPSTGWAFHPVLLADASTSTLYLGWVEQSAVGQKAEAYVSKLTGGVWTLLGGSLNMDPINGSAQHLSIGLFGGNPVAAWGEVNVGGLRQVYVKQWNGAGWVQLAGTGGAPDTTAPTSPSGLSATAVSPTQVDLAWSPSTDSVGVVGYGIYRNGSQIGSATESFSYQDATAIANTSYSYTVTAYDAAGNVSAPSSSANVTTPPVANSPVISAISASSITSSGAAITWTTDQPSDSQVNYGATASYGSTSALNSTLVTAHSVNLTGLAASTTYHYQVLSRDAQGLLASSGDLAFTTAAAAAGPPPVLQILGATSEVSGVTNGSVVTPATPPSGFTGTVVVNGAGSVNFAPAQGSNGVYFQNCCTGSNNAYFQFTGARLGSIFNVSQGQISFYLQSRYSFAQRQALASAYRYAFDVHDGDYSHLFYFLTVANSGYLAFSYAAAGAFAYYYVPQGTEDALFGNGVGIEVTITWNGTTSNLYLNGTLVTSTAYSVPTPNWTSASNFDLGAYDYFGSGYNVSDDIVADFRVTVTD
jgi:Galactose oxidase, central domain